MMKRVLLGSRLFGLVDSHNGNGSRIGVSVRVTESEILPDGRSLIKAKCETRFRILEKWDLDEYLMGSVEYFEDEPLDAEKIPECRNSFIEIEPVLDKLINVIYSTQIEVLLHDRPTKIQYKDDIKLENGKCIAEYSLWLCGFLNLNSDLRYYLLTLTNTTKRLAILKTLFPKALQNPDNELELARAAP